jgi:hypothetical protein
MSTVPATTCVYLMGNVEHNWFKIGMSSDPGRRLNDFTVPFALKLLCVVPMPDAVKARQTEKQLHEYYAPRRAQREWFTGVDPDEFIRQTLKFKYQGTDDAMVPAIALRTTEDLWRRGFPYEWWMMKCEQEVARYRGEQKAVTA